MSKAFRADVQGRPNRLRSAGLARVCGSPKAVIGGIAIEIFERLGRAAAFVTADTDSYNVALSVADREFEDALCRLDSKVADRVEDPENRDAEVALAALASALNAFEHRLEVMLPPMHDSDRDIYLGMQHPLLVQPLHHPVSGQLKIVSGEQTLRDCLKGHQESVKIGIFVEGESLLRRKRSGIVPPA